MSKRHGFSLVLSLVTALVVASCTQSPMGSDGTSVGAITGSTSLPVTTVTIQRGTYGTVLDSFIRSADMPANYGNRPHLRVSAKTESLIFFDLSAIPATAVVQSASLVLFRNGGEFEPVDDCADGSLQGFSTIPIYLHRATAYWSDRAVTYANFGQAFDPAIAGVIVPTQVHEFKTVDVTQLVQTWVGGAQPNYGLVLTTAARHHVLFASSNQPRVIERPALRITYTTPVNHCTAGLCQNGGTCNNSNTGYTCSCAAAFTGTNCQTRINNCAGSPCQNGGTCLNGTTGYTCTCAVGFTGSNCQTTIDECATAPCLNGGVCTDGVGTYTCSCTPDFNGTNCQTPVNHCAASPCENGGTCVDNAHGYTCTCTVGFTGSNCQSFVDYCVGDPCQNGGLCDSGLGSYTCDCAAGYGGNVCQNNLNQCAAAPCLNGATCTNGVNSYTCTCAPGFSGTNCDTDIDECAVLPCQNGGTCVDGINAYTCLCPANYSGTNCQTLVATAPTAPTITLVQPGPGQALVAFNPPSSNGGASITSYTVISTPGGITAMGANSPVIVTGLTNGVAYTFSVSATNAVGTSPVSSPSTSPVTPTGPPSAPSITGVATTDGAATVAFAAPASNGGLAFLTYTVISTPGAVSVTGSASPLVVRGLSDGTSYTFNVVASNADGSGPASAPSAAVTPTGLPSAPAVTSVTVPINQTTAFVSFAPPATNGGLPITAFTVTSNPGGLTATGITSPIAVTGLTDGVPYTFTVTATNSLGSGPASPPSTSVVPEGAPSAPTLTGLASGDGSVAVTFNTPSDTGATPITSYTVTSHPGCITGTGSASPVTVAGLIDGTAYTFTVTATNSVGTSPASNVSVSVIPVGLPSVPTITAVTPSDGQALVAFNPPASNGGLAIGAYTVTSSPGGIIAYGSSSPISIPGLSNGTSYTFTVTASNSLGTSASSSASLPVTPTSVAGAPSVTSVVTSSSTAVVSFTPPSNTGGLSVNSYVVTSVPGGFMATGATSPLTVTGLTNGQGYTFTVAALNSDGVGPASASSSLVVPTGVPGAPTITNVATGNGSAAVSFAPPATNGGLTITAYTVTSNPDGVTATGTSSPLTVTGLTDGVPYTFTVTATNLAGTGPSSPPTQNGSVPVGPPTAPAITGLVAGDSVVAVSFTPPSGNGGTPVLSYTVTSNPDGQTATGTTSPLTVSNLNDGTAYTFTVTATNAVGTSPPSAVSASATPVGPPSPPSITGVTGGSGSATINFVAPADNGGSPVLSYTVTSSPGGLTATGATSPITIAGLVNGQLYTFTVTANNGVGTSLPSASSGPDVPLGVPGAPTITSTSSSSGQVTVAFVPPTTNGGAQIYGYTVTSTPGGITASGASSPIAVAGLVNGVAYTFTVSAENSVGPGPASTSSPTVIPIGPPSAPVVTSATAGNGTVTVAFVPPTSNGGAPITNYTVTSSPGGITASGTSSPIVVSGLANGTAYTFTATATNSSGTSPLSAPSAAVVPVGVAGAPYIYNLLAGPGQVGVFFYAPLSTGGATITSYVVTSSPGGVSASGASSPIVVPGLVNGQAYTFTVRAVNVAGAGPSSYPSGAVIPSTVPDAPLISSVVVSGDATAVTVSFVENGSDGGSAITEYYLLASPGGSIGGVGSPMVFPSLHPGTVYTFTLYAENAAGLSAPSPGVTVLMVPVVRPRIVAERATLNGMPDLLIDVALGYIVNPGDGSEVDIFTGALTVPAPAVMPEIVELDSSIVLCTLDPDSGLYVTNTGQQLDLSSFTLYNPDTFDAEGVVTNQIYILTTAQTLVDPGNFGDQFDPLTLALVGGSDWTATPTPFEFRIGVGYF